ncbi:MAG: pirin family protein [Vicinamibacterales bacterium]
MSRRDPVAGEACVALGADHRRFDAYPTRELHLGQLAIRRALPIREHRLIGPWCFLDRFGPLSFSAVKPMDVAPHPHIGLQTVSWLLEGEIAHDDSLGSAAVLRPGGVNVMTAGDAIAHAEQTPRDHSGRLNGVQLWTALPEAVRRGPAGFVHVAEVPVVESPGGLARVFAGQLADARLDQPYFSPIVGADLQVHAAHTLSVPLDPTFEHAVLVLQGDASLDGEPLAADTMHYLGCARSEAEVASAAGARVLLVGGPPFPETILMWWNFVARTPEELSQARADWEARQRFGEVTAYRGARLEAPPLTRVVRPNPVS